MANMYNNPSLDPADNNSLPGAIRFAFSKLIQNVNGMLPAQVINYDRETNRVQVQLLISLLTTDGGSVSRAQIASLPVLLLGGGGIFLSFPITTGDLGWVIANDRDISNFLKTYAQAVPNTNRISKFSDGLFIPDIMRGYTLADTAEGAGVLQNLDGTVSIALSNTTVTITAPNVTVNATTVAFNAETVTGNAGSMAMNATNVTINAVDEVDITSGGNAIITLASGTGTLGVVGNITATGNITPDTPPP